MRESVLDSFEPLFDVLAPFSKLVEERPEDDHESPMVSFNLLDVFAALNARCRRWVRNGGKIAHIPNVAQGRTEYGLYRIVNILSTLGPFILSVPPPLVFRLLLVFVQI